MKNRMTALMGIALLGLGFTASAQATEPCPALPGESGLTWEHKLTGGMQFCRALRADGTEAFGLYIAKDTAFQPARADRAEASQIDGSAVQWYRSEIAGKPDLQARETLLTLPDGRVAHIWIQAQSKQELGETLAHTRQMRFAPNTQLSRN